MIIYANNIEMMPGTTRLIIELKQYDSDFLLLFFLQDKVGNLKIPEGTTAEVRGTKADGTGFSAEAAVDINKRVITVTGDQQMTAASGRGNFELVLTYSGKESITATFYIDVVAAALDFGTIPSETKIQEIADVIGRVDEITQAAADALDAQSAAAASAQAASVSAAGAANSQSAAAASADDAAASETAAAQSAQAAAQSAASFTVDAAMSATSENPVQNKIITGKMQSTAEADSAYHMGFYMDADGCLCQKKGA